MNVRGGKLPLCPHFVPPTNEISLAVPSLGVNRHRMGSKAKKKGGPTIMTVPSTSQQTGRVTEYSTPDRSPHKRVVHSYATQMDSPLKRRKVDDIGSKAKEVENNSSNAGSREEPDNARKEPKNGKSSKRSQVSVFDLLETSN